jgi:hypothetical protein
MEDTSDAMVDGKGDESGGFLLTCSCAYADEKFSGGGAGDFEGKTPLGLRSGSAVGAGFSTESGDASSFSS